MLPLALRRRKDLLATSSTSNELRVISGLASGTAKRMAQVLLWITVCGDALRIVSQLWFGGRTDFTTGLSLLTMLTGMVVLPVLLWRTWRWWMAACSRRWPLSDRGRDNLLFLLVLVLLGELAYFEWGEARTPWPSYSPLFPSFLAGPIIATLGGLVVLSAKEHFSFSGIFTLSCGVVWILVPWILDFEFYVGQSQAFDLVPMVRITSISFMAWTIWLWWSIASLGGLWLAPLFLAIPIWELWRGRIRFATAGVAVVSGFALAPFLREWQNHILD